MVNDIDFPLAHVWAVVDHLGLPNRINRSGRVIKFKNGTVRFDYDKKADLLTANLVRAGEIPYEEINRVIDFVCNWNFEFMNPTAFYDTSSARAIYVRGRMQLPNVSQAPVSRIESWTMSVTNIARNYLQSASDTLPGTKQWERSFHPFLARPENLRVYGKHK